MNDFTASSGISVERVSTGGLRVDYNNATVDSHIFVPAFAAKAVAEFAQSERDAELGRWRWPENPSLVVYANDYGVQVVDEFTGKGDIMGAWTREDIASVPYRPLESPLAQAADAYFAAHPEPKPWREAEEGEVWIITHNGNQYPAIFQAEQFRDHGGSWTVDSITAARRIWPEVSA